MLVFDPSGRIEFVNDAFLAEFGFEVDELLGRNLRALARKNSLPLLEACLEQAKGSGLKASTDRSIELPWARKDGSICEVEFAAWPIEIPNPQTARLCASLRLLPDEDRLRRREAAVFRALSQLGAGASMLAHEIKNPLAAVNLALRAVARALDQEENAVLEDLASRLENLEQLLRHTLAFARPLEVKRATLRLNDLLHGCPDTIDSGANGEQVKVELTLGPEDATLSGSFNLLKHALGELIMNASDAVGGQGQIRVGAAQDQNGYVIFVEDTGPGVSERARETLFDPFTTTKAEGHGMGLAIARKVVEAHGGRLELAWTRPGSTRFEIRLPR